MNKVTLQINLTWDDYYHSKYLLDHQLGVFHDQVNEVLLIFDNKPSKQPINKNQEQAKSRFEDLICTLKTKYPRIAVQDINYKPEAIKNITKKFFNVPTPTHDFRGAPVYGYLYGLHQSKNDYVLHIDSDMFFGGRSKKWVTEALEILESNTNVLTVSPLPGPPHPQGILTNQPNSAAVKGYNYRFEFSTMSTRIFLINKNSLYNRLSRAWDPITEIWLVLSRLQGFSTLHALETSISKMMQSNSLNRIDFKGEEPGMWSIHPLIRCENFYLEIPNLISRINDNDIPKSQLGNYNFCDDFVDCSKARELANQTRLRKTIFKNIWQHWSNQNT